MAKRRPKSDADPTQVPCVRVVVGGPGFKKAKVGAKDAQGCQLSTTKQDMSARKVSLRKEIGATSKSVDHVAGRRTCGGDRKSKCPAPCLGTEKRKTCPVQLAFDRGQPFLRFCFRKKKTGYRINVDSVADAVAVSDRACAHWREHRSFDGFFPPDTTLNG